MPQYLWQKIRFKKNATKVPPLQNNSNSMEKDKKIRELLGLKQEDMAILLRVTRTQWSMYEIGKRELPPAAQLKLIQLLAFINQPKTEKADSFLDLTNEEAKTKKVFENLKLVNKHQQILTERKIQAIEKKQEAGITALRLIRFLETNDSPIVTEQKALWTVIKLSAENKLRKSGIHIQAKLQFKLKMLMEEERLLNERILD